MVKAKSKATTPAPAPNNNPAAGAVTPAAAAPTAKKPVLRIAPTTKTVAIYNCAY